LAGEKYIGIGPSAHSYDGFPEVGTLPIIHYISRRLMGDKLPNEIEILSVSDRYNEYIMTGLHHLNLERIKLNLGNPI
jgi:oxygen-independent coproporphyrinogen-3 oxidase